MNKTAVEIIKETFEYYSDVSKRALGSLTCENTDAMVCVYLSEENGNKCAIGRCMNDKADFNFCGDVDEYCFDNGLTSEEEEYPLDAHLKEEYHGHTLQFWSNLQDLHDTSVFWDDKGPSEQGEKYYKTLLERYAKN